MLALVRYIMRSVCLGYSLSLYIYIYIYIYRSEYSYSLYISALG